MAYSQRYKESQNLKDIATKEFPETPALTSALTLASAISLHRHRLWNPYFRGEKFTNWPIQTF